MKLLMPVYVLKYEDDGHDEVYYFEDIKEFTEKYESIKNGYYIHNIRCYQGTLTEIEE
jgi:hypothetical protein